MTTRYGILTLALAVFLMHCGDFISPSTTAGNGSSVGGGIITGTILEPDSTTPAEGTVVEVRYKNATAQIHTASAKAKDNAYTTVTDTDGRFTVDTLGTGVYIIEGSDGDGNMVLFDSITIEPESDSRTLPPGILQPAGCIKGKFIAEKAAAMPQVFVLAFGVDRFCRVADDGSFLFKDFAAGVYTLKVISLNNTYETATIADISVTSGETTDIGEQSLSAKESGQPLLSLVYDTLNSQVKLNWEPIQMAGLEGYHIYESTTDALHAAFFEEEYYWKLCGTAEADADSFQVQVSPLIDETRYYYVAAFDSTGTDKQMTIKSQITTVSTLICIDTIELAPFPSWYEDPRIYIDDSEHILVLSSNVQISDTRTSLRINYTIYSLAGTIIAQRSLTNCIAGSFIHFPDNWPLTSDSTIYYTHDDKICMVSNDGICTTVGTIPPEYIDIIPFSFPAGDGYCRPLIAADQLYLDFITDTHLVMRLNQQDGTLHPWGASIFQAATVNAFTVTSQGFAIHTSTDGVQKLSHYSIDETLISECDYPVEIGDLITSDDSLIIGSDGFAGFGSDGEWHSANLLLVKDIFGDIGFTEDGRIIVPQTVNTLYVYNRSSQLQ